MNTAMRSLRGAAAALAVTLTLAGPGLATPTTNVWNPSTDVQAKGVPHLGVDVYFSTFANVTRPYAAPVDVGLTYGLGHGFEVGVDVFEPSVNPLVFNAKWGYPERGDGPAFAVGIQGVGTHETTQSNIVYGLVAKSFREVGRFTLGGYVGHANVIGSDNAGVIAAWDKAFSSKWWASVDYASGQNAYGALSGGVAYKFAPNVGVVFGYVFFNESDFFPNDAATVQVDIDF
jgi:long-subunit fatty acid transport protein